LGAYLAQLGRRVLLIDFDPQGNLSSVLKGDSNLSATIYHGLAGLAQPAAVVRPSRISNYDFIPADNNLAGLLVELVGEPEREYFLRKFVNHLRHLYNYILIDLPPSLSLLTVNGLMAADEVLIPVQAEYYGLEGLSQLLETVALIQTNLNHPIKVAGALITMYDRRERLSRDVEKNLRRYFPHPVFETLIPRAVALAEAPSFGKTILEHDPASPGAQAYRRLAEEIVGKEIQNYPPTANFGNFMLS